MTRALRISFSIMLASDDASYINSVELFVDGGAVQI
jgi:hypothetical protein